MHLDTCTCKDTHTYAHTHVYTHTHIPETFPKWLSFPSSSPGKDRKLQGPDGTYLLRCFLLRLYLQSHSGTRHRGDSEQP